MRLLTASVIFVLLAAIANSAQNKSVYTSTKTSACRTIVSTNEGTGSYEGECRGVGGYKVRLIEGDIRQTLNIVTPARKKHALNFWGFYPSFSAIGEKIEWRIKGGVLVALIARYSVADPEDSTKSTLYLLVSKIGLTESCVTDVVKPGPKQNEEARTLADVAPTKPCKKTE
ncbi:MAG TPA: hypothetical protein VNA17_02295 [Pyrinomonadaceae bacterium]|nr:hypothetical protein [Pyrinomonadaceae bacterium]